MYNTKSLPRGVHGCENEKGARALSNYSSHREQPQQQQSNSNYSTNTLPKNHHQQQPSSQQIYGKATNPSRSLLNDVVNKVPSVIMLPLPTQQQQLQQSSTQSANNNNHNILKGGGISMLKTSSSKDNLCDSKNDDRITGREIASVATTTTSSASGSACHSQNSTLKRSKSKKEVLNANEKLISSKGTASSNVHHEKIVVVGGCMISQKCIDKQLPVLTTTTNCTNPKEHFLPNETSLDDDYLSECENCKTAGTGSRYYLDDEEIDEPQETMTLQRKLMNENDENDQQNNYYRVSSTLPTNTNKKIP